MADLTLNALSQSEQSVSTNMKFDTEDGIWRCGFDGWEVEPDDDTRATCAKGHRFDTSSLPTLRPVDERSQESLDGRSTSDGSESDLDGFVVEDSDPDIDHRDVNLTEIFYPKDFGDDDNMDVEGGLGKPMLDESAEHEQTTVADSEDAATKNQHAEDYKSEDETMDDNAESYRGFELDEEDQCDVNADFLILLVEEAKQSIREALIMIDITIGATDYSLEFLKDKSSLLKDASKNLEESIHASAMNTFEHQTTLANATTMRIMFEEQIREVKNTLVELQVAMKDLRTGLSM